MMNLEILLSAEKSTACTSIFITGNNYSFVVFG